MADDTNSSKMPPQNVGFGADSIGRIEKSTYKVSKQERDARMTAKTYGTQLNAFAEYEEGGGDISDNRRLMNMKSNAQTNLPKAQQRIRSSIESRLERGNTQYANQVAREYSETAMNGSIREFSEQQGVQNKAFGLNGQSHQQLSSRRQELDNQIQMLGADSQAVAGKAFTSRGVNQDVKNAIVTNASKASQMTQEMASIDLALKTVKQSGQDPLSKFNSLNASGRSASDVLNARALGKETQDGGVSIQRDGVANTVKKGDIQGAIVSEAANLQKNLKALSEAAAAGATDLDALRKKAEESAENFEKLKQAASSGAGGMSKGQMLGMAGGLINTVTQAGQDIMINQRMGQMSNTAGFAGMANQQYDMYKKARGGDVASQLALGQVDDAGTFGMEMKRATNVVQTGTIAAGMTTVGAGIAEMTEGGTDKVVGIGGHFMGNGGVSTEEFISGLQHAAQGTAAVGVTSMDMTRGVSSGQNQIAGTQAAMQAKQAIQAIGAEQMQGLRNMYTGLDVVGQGMGRNASAFIDDSTSKGNLDKMISSNISPDQFVNAAQLGNDAMGSIFSSDAIYKAREAEKSGFGSVGQNMQRMGALAGAGSNNPSANLESVIQAGMTKSLDSSKSISAMVEHTAAMVAQNGGSTAAGIDNFKNQAALIAGSIDPNIKNKEFALERAANAQEVSKNITTDTSVSFAGMVNTARINKTTGLGGTDALFAAKLTTADLKSLQGMDPKLAEEALLKKGVNASSAKGGVNGFLSQQINNQIDQSFTGGGALAFGNNTQRESLAADAKGGKSYSKLTKEEKDLLGKMGTSQGINGDEYYNAAAGIKNTKVADPVTGKGFAGSDAGADSTKNKADDLRTSGFKQMSEAALTAATQLEKFGGAMKVFTELTKSYEKGGKKNEEAFSGAGAKMASEFSTSIGLFKDATGDYQKASNAIVKALTGSNGNPVKPEFLDRMNQKKGSKQ